VSPQLPATLTLNAFTGEDDEVSGALVPQANKWGSGGEILRKLAPLAPGDPVNLADWTHPKVGWGVVLPDDDKLTNADRALGVDAPEPIRQLLADRPGAPVLRYRPDLGVARLARYLPDGGRQDPLIGLSQFGVEPGRLPLYLLIVGSPSVIPWKLQYSLNRRHHAGRLDLDDEGLANYVSALRNDWAGMSCDSTKPVVWSVNYDTMTLKMDTTIAKLVREAMAGDPEVKPGITDLTGDAAIHDALQTALVDNQPSVVITSSHGKTGPLGNLDAMRASLGLPVDANRSTLDIDALLAEWSPSGAVWYAQACCSAGSDDGTSYVGLLEEDSMANKVTQAVGKLGPTVAPLPTRLLGATQPLRAFIGHVEPTFDWTLIEQETGQFLTLPLVNAIYPNIFRRCPVGISLDEFYRGVGDLCSYLAAARNAVDAFEPGARDRATYYRLTASDRQSLVILGDPTVAIPPLPSQVTRPHPPLACGNEVGDPTTDPQNVTT
jgi:hypothetical protein